MTKLSGEYKVLTLDEKKNLKYGDHVYIEGYKYEKHIASRTWLSVKINGKPKIWKRSPEKVQVPYKYGLYEYGYITEKDEARIAL